MEFACFLTWLDHSGLVLDTNHFIIASSTYPWLLTFYINYRPIMPALVADPVHLIFLLTEVNKFEAISSNLGATKMNNRLKFKDLQPTTISFIEPTPFPCVFLSHCV